MSSTFNHCRSPVRWSPALVGGSLCSPVSGHSNMGVGAETSGPCSPHATIQKWTRSPSGANDSSTQEGQALPSVPTTGHVYIWSADGACVLNALGEPPGAGGGCNRRVLACMGVARVCVCPVHTNAREMHGKSWAVSVVHGPYTSVLCAGASTAAPAPAPLEECQLLARLLIQWAGCSTYAQVHHRF